MVISIGEPAAAWSHSLVATVALGGGGVAEAESAYELGLAVSLGGPVTFQNARKLRAMLSQLRLDRLLVETDAPYLAPHPYRGQRNEPGYVPLIVQALAPLVGTTAEAVAAQSTATALECFDRIAH
jgi:TatD DNase family protein